MVSFFSDLGCVDYKSVHELQLHLVQRKNDGELEQDVILLCQHFPTYTLGKNAGRGEADNLRVDDQFLKEKNIETVQIERGGEITYHGPGQLVLYPLIDLRRRKLRLKEYVTMLEEIMIRLASHFGVVACRNSKNAGIWREDGSAKIGSIGIAVRRGVAFHGLAINVNPDLEPFRWINPCGLQNVRVTSLAEETSTALSIKDAKKQLIKIVEELLGEINRVEPTSLFEVHV